MKRIFTIGTPNMGISDLQEQFRNDHPYISSMIPRTFAYKKAVLEKMVPANFVNLIGSEK